MITHIKKYKFKIKSNFIIQEAFFTSIKIANCAMVATTIYFFNIATANITLYILNLFIVLHINLVKLMSFLTFISQNL